VLSVLIALADVGPGVQLEEQLASAGASPRWDAAQSSGPLGAVSADVVVLDADHLADQLPSVADAWRASPSVPGLVAIGSSPAAREHAPLARVTLIAPTAKISTLAAAIREAAALRLASGLSWAVLRAATGLPPLPDDPAEWPHALVAARKVSLDIPRTALRWHALHYATPTARLDALREDRVLTVPELEIAAQLDGTRTIQSLVAAGPLDPGQCARFLWALACLGALDVTPDVRDVATTARRALSEVRADLRARAARLERSTFYDVLEVTPLAEYPEIQHAYSLLATRFSPRALESYDLGDLGGAASTVRPMWDLVEKARAVLVDHAQRGRYHDWLRHKLRELRTVWALDPKLVEVAAASYVRGQRALGEGDVHRAMSELATACRQFPGHPEYEASFAWSRYRVQVASGRDRLEAAAAERTAVEELLRGRRPWPRALVALALLCAAGGDADAARWHLHVALAVDPSVPAAAQLAQRLGMRR
jgi:hypothetical protein